MRIPRAPSLPPPATSMEQEKRGFTLVELLVVMAIISLLAGMLLPVLSKALETARTASCANNEKQQHLALTLYAEDWNSYVPSSLNHDVPPDRYPAWKHFLVDGPSYDDKKYGQRYVPVAVFYCPKGIRVNNDRGNYGMSRYVPDANTPEPSLPFWQFRPLCPSRLYLAGDSTTGKAEIIPPSSHMAYRHQQRANILFADGHTQPFYEINVPTNQYNSPPQLPWRNAAQ